MAASSLDSQELKQFLASTEPGTGTRFEIVQHCLERTKLDVAELDAALQHILDIQLQRHGRNLDGYKKSMLLHRIGRRMALRRIDSLANYAALLRQDHNESAALSNDLVICVGGFFRDPKVWDDLYRKVLAPLIKKRNSSEPIRAWVCGTSTGEQAYTLTILILEALEQAGKRCPIQVFATDVNPSALAVARAGRYSAAIADQIPQEYLSKYFTATSERDHYRVSPELRGNVVFSRHDLFDDPPFLHLDVVVCRCLLDNLEPDAQRRALLRFHLALGTNGGLLLGAPDGVIESAGLFKSVAKLSRVYRKIGQTPRNQLALSLGGRKLVDSGAQIVERASGAQQPAQAARRMLLEEFVSASMSVDSKVANEELESVNEELKSAKEELQSLNEELQFANQRLHGKVTELQAANDDLNNLLASSEIFSICLDRNLTVRWHSPGAHELLNIRSSDIGRPIGALTSRLLDQTLLEGARSVMASQTPVQSEVQSEHGLWYLRRILPYRTNRSAADGVIVTLTDVSSTKQIAAERSAERLKTAAALQKRADELRAMTFALSMTEERERRNVAAELHDGLGQLISLIKVKLAMLVPHSRSSSYEKKKVEIATLVDQALDRMRSLMFQLSPPVLHELGLWAALEWLADEMKRLYGLKVVLKGQAIQLSDSVVRTVLFRAIRELLINVWRHAKVSTAEVECTAADDRLRITVLDHGVGFEASERLDGSAMGGHFGLANVRERIEYIGGEFTVRSNTGAGTEVTIITPFISSSLAPAT